MKILPIDMHKWKLFEIDLKKHLDEKQMHFLGRIYIQITKHFTHRVLERSSEVDKSRIRRTLYHVINTRMCELIFWLYSEEDKEILVHKDDLCIILTRSNDNTGMVVRTFYKKKNVNKERYFYLKI